MKYIDRLVLVTALFCGVMVGCTAKPKEFAPAKLGDRNDNCQAKNDCSAGLSCINSRCQPTDYELSASGNECIRHQCDETEDCCGDRPSNPPSKCAGIESICNTPFFPGCTNGSTCEETSDCGDGSCEKEVTRTCSVTGLDCTLDEANCYVDTCVITSQYDPYTYTTIEVGTCSFSNTSCEENTDCPYYGDECGEEVTADVGICDCTNPDYDPSADICSDSDCSDVCTLVCDNNLCLEDDSCADDDECPAFAPICAKKQCVECEADDDCDTELGEECRSGSCERPCEFDQECPAFNECQSGDCVFVGCTTNTDCVLFFEGAEGARLAECVSQDGIGECRIPCENDSHCAETEVCQDSFCEYIGCETDAQCDRLLGLQGQNVTPEVPYVTQGLCVAPEVPEVEE